MYRFTWLALLAMSACAQPSGTTTQQPVPAPVDSGYFNVAGVLQHNGQTQEWMLIRDGEHDTLNVDHIICNGDHLEVYYTLKADKVIAMSITMDDVYALNGYHAGASVGQDKFYLFFSHLENGVIVKKNCNEMYAGGGEAIFFYGIFKKASL